MTASKTPNDRDLPILEHLVELRNRVVWSAVATLIAVAVCFAYVGPIWDFLVEPLNQALEATGKGSENEKKAGTFRLGIPVELSYQNFL